MACATSPMVTCAIRSRKWPLSGVFSFNRQYVRSGHYGEEWDFFATGVMPSRRCKDFLTSAEVGKGEPGTGDRVCVPRTLLPLGFKFAR